MNERLHHLRKTWLGRSALLLSALWLVVAPSGQAIAAGTEAPEALNAAEAPPADVKPAVAKDDDAAAAERPARRRSRSHGDPVVSIGGNVNVGRGKSVEGAVVIRGDALIDGDVQGDVVVVLGHVKLTGKVSGDVVVVMGDAEVDGDVAGDLVMVMTHGQLGPNAEVHGQLEAIGVPPVIDARAKIEGRPEIVDLGPIAKYLDWVKDYLFHGVFWLRPFPPGLGWVWAVAGAFLVFHLLIALLFGGALRGCIGTLAERPARSFLVGLLTCILVGPISVLLSFTVVAIPLIWLAYFLLCLFGRVAVYGAAGAGMMGRRGEAVQPFVSVLLGSLLFYVAYMIPVLGFLVYWVVLPWGVGATLMYLVDTLRRERGGGVRNPGYATGGDFRADAMASAIASGQPGPAPRAAVETVGAGGDSGAEGAGVSGLAGGGAGEAERSRLPGNPPPLMPGPGPGLIELAAAQRAGFWPRLGAALIDLLLVGFVNVMTFDAARSFWFLLAVYHVAMWSWKGTTVGGSILGLRLIRLDGRLVDWQTCAYRALGAVVSLLPLGLGFIWVAWDPECQSWHDRIAGTVVVKADRRSSLV